MKQKFHMQDFIHEMNRMYEGEEILQYILSYYDIYSGQFKEVPEYDTEYGPYSLNTRIRNYIKFDDSE